MTNPTITRCVVCDGVVETIRETHTIRGKWQTACECYVHRGATEAGSLATWHRWHNGVLARAKKVLEERNGSI